MFSKRPAAVGSPVWCGSTASVFAACLPVAGSVQNAAVGSPVDCGSTASVFAACLPVAGSVQNAAVWSPVDGCRPKTKKRNTNVI